MTSNPVTARRELNEVEEIAFLALQKTKLPLRSYADNSDVFIIIYEDEETGNIDEYWFCPDFVVDNRLIVEVDGVKHDEDKVKRRDIERQAVVDSHNQLRKKQLASTGASKLLELEIWRWPAHTVKEDPAGFATAVKERSRSMGII